MFSPPTGPHLSQDQIREVDDAFFSSDPTGYFRSRIDSLLQWSDWNDHTDGDLAKKFAHLLGPAAQARSNPNDESRQLQVATDAFSVRHHAAESLVRLLTALLDRRANGGQSSLWVTLVDGPTSTHRLNQHLFAHTEMDNFEAVLAGLLLPLPYGTVMDRDQRDAVSNAWKWIHYASTLIVSGELDIHAANNKVKHGFAMKPVNDLRMTFTAQGPDEDGTIDVSSLNGEGTLTFDTILLDCLSRPSLGGVKQGLERTLLRAEPAQLLAETWMIAMTHGALFSVAAGRYFDGRSDIKPPTYPGIGNGPSPKQVIKDRTLGMRIPKTDPPGGGPSVRGTGFGTFNHFRNFHVGAPVRRIVVRDDREPTDSSRPSPAE